MKIAIIYDRDKRNIFFKMISGLCKTESFYVSSSSEIVRILQSKNPGLVLLNLKKSAKGEDLMSLVNAIDDYNPLRISLITVNRLNISLFKSFGSGFSNFFKNRFHLPKSGSKIKGAFERR